MIECSMRWLETIRSPALLPGFLLNIVFLSFNFNLGFATSEQPSEPIQLMFSPTVLTTSSNLHRYQCYDVPMQVTEMIITTLFVVQLCCNNFSHHCVHIIKTYILAYHFHYNLTRYSLPGFTTSDSDNQIMTWRPIATSS